MDKRVLHLAAAVSLVATLGAFAGAGSDRGVVTIHSPRPEAPAHEMANRAGGMMVMHAHAGGDGE